MRTLHILYKNTLDFRIIIRPLFSYFLRRFHHKEHNSKYDNYIYTLKSFQVPSDHFDMLESFESAYSNMDGVVFVARGLDELRRRLWYPSRKDKEVCQILRTVLENERIV